MKFLSIILALLLSACSTLPTPALRHQLADALAASHGWQAMSVPTKPFTLVAYIPAKAQRSHTLTIYIEGDGFAWITSSRPSSDPTPLDPLALKLALAQPAGNSAYLARACQYIDAERTGCVEHYWTNKRFAPEVIDSTNRAIDALKVRFGARRLILVGYSGGAAVAALSAARRHDVVMLVTVAGNLDHHAWTTYHRIQPLSGSLNPADETDSLNQIRQWHYVGGSDQIIPPVLVQGFAARFPSTSVIITRVEPDFGHRCCWADNWPKLWWGIQNDLESR